MFITIFFGKKRLLNLSFLVIFLVILMTNGSSYMVHKKLNLTPTLSCLLGKFHILLSLDKDKGPRLHLGYPCSFQSKFLFQLYRSFKKKSFSLIILILQLLTNVLVIYIYLCYTKN